MDWPCVSMLSTQAKPFSSHQKTISSNRYYGASGISYFPGKGNDYPVKPGQTIIVAKYAIDHKANFEAELEGEDLSMYGGLMLLRFEQSRL